MVLSVAVDVHLHILAEALSRFLSHRPVDRFDGIDVAALVFWLRLGDVDKNWPLIGGLRKPVLETMATRIGAMPKKIRTKVEAHLKTVPYLKEPGPGRALGSFLADVDASRQSWLSRLMSRGRTIIKTRLDHGSR